MKRASAIVTNRGGRTCHAAIIARELGIPAVVGTGSATRDLADGQEVTVSCAEGDTGFVYDGRREFSVTETSLEDMPELPEPYNNLAVLYAAKGRYDDARRVLETAVQANPDYALARENLGDLYARLAAREYEQAAKLAPKSAAPREKLEIVQRVLQR